MCSVSASAAETMPAGVVRPRTRRTRPTCSRGRPPCTSEMDFSIRTGIQSLDLARWSVDRVLQRLRVADASEHGRRRTSIHLQPARGRWTTRAAVRGAPPRDRGQTRCRGRHGDRPPAGDVSEAPGADSAAIAGTGSRFWTWHHLAVTPAPESPCSAAFLPGAATRMAERRRRTAVNTTSGRPTRASISTRTCSTSTRPGPRTRCSSGRSARVR